MEVCLDGFVVNRPLRAGRGEGIEGDRLFAARRRNGRVERGDGKLRRLRDRVARVGRHFSGDRRRNVGRYIGRRGRLLGGRLGRRFGRGNGPLFDRRFVRLFVRDTARRFARDFGRLRGGGRGSLLLRGRCVGGAANGLPPRLFRGFPCGLLRGSGRGFGRAFGRRLFGGGVLVFGGHEVFLLSVRRSVNGFRGRPRGTGCGRSASRLRRARRRGRASRARPSLRGRGNSRRRA